MPVKSFNRDVFVFLGIGLSVVLSSIGGNAEVLEKVSYSVNYYTVDHYDEIQDKVENREEGKRYDYMFWEWTFSKLACWFTFQCTDGCQCNLAATNITIMCPNGSSIVKVRYPSGNWSLSHSSASDWSSSVSSYSYSWDSLFELSVLKNYLANLETSSSESSSSAKYDTLISIYFWHDSGLSSITQGAFKHLGGISECYLILSRNNLEDIQARQFEELSKLHGLFLDNNKIDFLHQNAFTGLESLVYLYLQRNKIPDILPNQFEGVPDLEELYIDHNNISEIGQQDFQGLNYLAILNIAYNKIVEIHSRGFEDLPNLLELHLGHNNISEIHPQLFQNLNKLSELSLDHNMISEIHPFQFQNLIYLKFLYLHHNSISETHRVQFQNLFDLRYLYLHHNKLTTIHSYLIHDLTLELRLDHNTISEFPSHLFSKLNKVNLLILDIGQNKISQIHPLQFQNLTKLYELYLDRNMISAIHPLQFQYLTRLFKLYLDHNRISEIHPSQFQNLNGLSILHLDYNNIVTIHSYQFRNINEQVKLYLSHNKINEIRSHLFRRHSNLWHLYLDHNNISKIHPQVFPNLSGFLELHLEYNKISEIPVLLFQNVTELQWLQLDHNDITEIHPNLFQNLHDLRFLDLSHNNLVKFTITSSDKFRLFTYLSLSNNKLSVISNTMFQLTITGILSLRNLDISNNRINIINSMIHVNSSITTIDLIDLRQNTLYSLSTESFSGFTKSTVVLVDNEATCCFLTAVNCSATIPKSQFLTCGRLLPNQIQRVNMWILGLFALLSNLGVLFYKYRSKENENKVQLLLISNLSISDMIMGVYMIMISSADLFYKRSFPSEFWRVSFACKFAGTLSVLSSEASVFFVTLISVDRLQGIKFPFSTYRIGTRTSRKLSLVLWLVAMSISIVSTILSSINPDWYDVSEVCTGLPLSRKNVYEKRFETYELGIIDYPDEHFGNKTYDVITSHQPGMYFGIAIFTALNFICFMVTCVCYTEIFLYSIQTAKQAGRARDKKQELNMATKMGAIVMTDLLCWAPIIILSILVQSGRHVVTPRVYTWIVTFVLPINSAINPFLYTLAAVIFDSFNKKQGLDPRNVRK